MKNNLLYQWMFLIVFTTACSSPQTRTLQIADTIMKSKSDPDLAEVFSLANGFKENDFSAARLKKYSDAGIDRLYNALFRIAFFFPEQEKYISFQGNVLDEKLRRGKRVNYDLERMHKAYIGARKFEKAVILGNRFPDVKFQRVPSVILDNSAGETAWRVYDISDGAEKAMLKALPVGTGLKVVMEIFTGCSAAETAMDQLLIDPVLSALFKKYGVLLTSRFDAEGILLWRNHFNFPEVYIAYKATDFPGFDFESSPNFYFLKDGEIKFSFSGWSNSNDPNYGPNNMRKGFEAISLTQHPPQ